MVSPQRHCKIMSTKVFTSKWVQEKKEIERNQNHGNTIDVSTALCLYLIVQCTHIDVSYI